MYESIEYKINKAVCNFKSGKILFPTDFSKIGTGVAVRQALSRLVKKGVLMRIASGIYLYPKKHKIFGVLQPSIEAIAQAIAKRDRARIIPTGINALNKLGLSTQIPMNTVYLTDGTPRTVNIDKSKIKFKIASPKILSAKSETVLLVIMAMKELGHDSIDNRVLKKVIPLLKEIDANTLEHDLKLAPTWIKETLENALL